MLLARSWALLGRGLVLSGASWGPPASEKEASGVDFGSAFGSKNDDLG